MYTRNRDLRLQIPVRQVCCFSVTAKNGVEWIEVFVPPKSLNDVKSNWSSIMVKPSQINTVEGTPYNVVSINVGATVRAGYRGTLPNGQQYIQDSEYFTPEEMLARCVMFERWCNHKEVHTLDEIMAWHLEKRIACLDYIV